MPLKVLHFASTNLGKFYLISIQNNRFVKGSFYNELTALLSLVPTKASATIGVSEFHNDRVNYLNK